MSAPTVYNRQVALTASDSIDNPAGLTDAVYVGSIAGGATMTVVLRNGDTCAYAGLVAGSILPIQCRRINSTGTLASSFVGLYMV